MKICMISSTIKTLVCVCACLLVSTANAQTTQYYRLTRKVVHDVSSTDVSGGQFITFLSDICYESDKSGIGVGHGTMTLNRNYSSDSYKTYMGDSYWGSEAAFKFNSDKSVLNVITDDGDVYVYKRTAPPSGVTTCSLIRKKTDSGTASASYAGGGGYYPVTPTYDNSGMPANSSGTGSYTGSTGNSGNPRQPTSRQCPYCDGTGRRTVDDTSIVTFGQTPYWKRCDECGRRYLSSTNHYHTQCSHCHGTGQITSY